MTRSELISRIASKMPNLTVRDIDRIVSVIFDKMTESLVEETELNCADSELFLCTNP